MSKRDFTELVVIGLITGLLCAAILALMTWRDCSGPLAWGEPAAYCQPE